MTFSLMKFFWSFWFYLSVFLVPNTTEPDYKSKDWVFLNYTYKRFEGLTQRGSIPTYMKAGKLWMKITLAQNQENSGSCITGLLCVGNNTRKFSRRRWCLWLQRKFYRIRISETTIGIGWQCQLAFLVFLKKYFIIFVNFIIRRYWNKRNVHPFITALPTCVLRSILPVCAVASYCNTLNRFRRNTYHLKQHRLTCR